MEIFFTFLPPPTWGILQGLLIVDFSAYVVRKIAQNLVDVARRFSTIGVAERGVNKECIFEFLRFALFFNL